ncbi:uncharacterized protein [Temnothorax longispinosus]|uniref:uncharacterized protein n=1 Tax=Temnothorax longispinosus TaxID=300112 RepID=UPI003A99C387
MIDRLAALDCPAGIVRFICKWLYLRTVRSIVNSQEFIERLVFKGLPQGAVLSPALYSLYTGGLCSDLPEGVEAGEFADDIVLYIRGPNRQRNKTLLQQAVNMIAGRLRDIGLGIWIDNGLKFSHQVQEVRGKVDRANSVLRYLCRVSKGLEVNTAFMLYKSLVRSVTEYGSFVYFPRDSATQVKLERAQYKGIRTALGYRNSTPNNVIIAEAKVRLLRDRAEMLARNFIYRSAAYDVTGLCNRIQKMYDCEVYVRYRQPMYGMSLLSRVWKNFIPIKRSVGISRKHEIFLRSYEAHTYRPTTDFSIGLVKKANNKYSDTSMVNDILDKYGLNRSSEIIFTDGSYDPSCCATGASLVLDGQDIAYKISLPSLCSSFTAKVFAIKAALQLMIRQRDSRDGVVI